MVFHSITPKDFPALCQLWEACSGVGLNEWDDSPTGLQAFLERNPSTCFAAWEGQELVASILAGHDGRRGHIYHLAVAKSYRRQGIASRLVNLSLQALRREGIRKTALVVFRTNREGKEFWEKQGFSLREDLSYRDKRTE